MTNKIPAEKEKRIREEFGKFPFPALLGVEVESLEHGSARIKLPFRPELTQGQDYLHGGAITSICDSAVALALATMIDRGEYMLTIELKTNYTAPADDDVFAKARIIHKGNHTAVGEVDVSKSDGTLVAKSIVTYFLK
ncbi:MAG: PaaI family thioesterase [Candidatus Zixiibacteriota bacterium]|nr:MAG: PaaI family thioesterase [candidate division Zixibacteria bacterium]